MDWHELWSHAESELGGAIGLLVNNAGVAPNQWRTTIDINFTGVAIGTYLALEKMDTTKVTTKTYPTNFWITIGAHL